MSGDDDRPKLSWREIDQRRSGAGGGRREEREPRGRAAQVRAKAATEQSLKEADKLFVSGKGGAEGAALAEAVRDAHGTDELAEACRAYLDTIGMPVDPAILGIFLDANDKGLVVATLEGMLDLQSAGSLEMSSGLRAQLRILAQDFDDSVAGAAEDLLEQG